MNKEIDVCKFCIMDKSVPDIQFDDNGNCQYCTIAQQRIDSQTIRGDDCIRYVENLISAIKEHGKNKKYDCIIGVSGGVDSSYIAYLTYKYGLRPLAVHLDNGWNSELSVKNIEVLLGKFDIDLYTHVINWDEFVDIQHSFLKASIANAEIPSDQAIVAILYKIAAKNGVKYIINGGNINSESIMPDSWMEDNLDTKLIKSVHKQFGSRKIRTYPMMGYYKLAYYTLVKGIRYIGLLNYLEYDKNEAMNFLETDIGWRRYDGKHFESIFTRWFQSFYLPKKFNIDKRKAHYSSLIASKQMDRQTALKKIEEPILPEKQIKEDCEFIKEKFAITDQQFSDLLSKPRVSINQYKNHQWMINKFSKAISLARSIATNRT